MIFFQCKSRIAIGRAKNRGKVSEKDNLAAYKIFLNKV